MLEIEIVYGLPNMQMIVSKTVSDGTTAREAALNSGLEQMFPEIDLASSPLGIFGKKVKDDTPLRNGDRVEIYRPLLIDPKEARRRRVQNQEEN